MLEPELVLPELFGVVEEEDDDTVELESLADPTCRQSNRFDKSCGKGGANKLKTYGRDGAGRRSVYRSLRGVLPGGYGIAVGVAVLSGRVNVDAGRYGPRMIRRNQRNGFFGGRRGRSDSRRPRLTTVSKVKNRPSGFLKIIRKDFKDLLGRQFH